MQYFEKSKGMQKKSTIHKMLKFLKSTGSIVLIFPSPSFSVAWHDTVYDNMYVVRIVIQ